MTEPISERLRKHFPPGAVLHKAVGCAECGDTGYRGRLALLEILVASPEVERRVAANVPSEQIAEAARASGMRSLWESGVQHAVDGVTTLDELLRVLEPPSEYAETKPAAPPPPARPSGSTTKVEGVERSQRTSMPVQRRTPPPADAPPVRRSGTLHGGPAAPVFDGAEFELLDESGSANGANAPSGPVVLLVEDEESLRRVLRDLLERDGFVVHEAADGVAALDEIDRAAPDIVVLDLNLPRLDGYGVLSHLRSRPATRDLPVVVLTAKGDEDSEVRVFEYGASEFLTKPFRPRALVARLNAKLNRR